MTAVVDEARSIYLDAAPKPAGGLASGSGGATPIYPALVVLALDLGTRCGFAVSGSPPISGTWDLAPAKQRRFEGAGMKWLRLRSFLDETHKLRPVGRVVVEEVRRHLGVDAAHAYGGALAVVSAWCEANNVPYSGVPVATIKKHATGKGNAKKEAMMEAARGRGWSPADDNEADALWLLDAVVGGAA
jgi:crossover junction endodeoxyribonuclease RuvC